MSRPWYLPVLFCTGLAAGFVDSIAGGGGLLTLPVVMSLGMPPQQALGTNKLQASFGSGSAAFHYARGGIVTFRECARGFAFTFAGSIAGTIVVQHTDPSFLKKFIPVLLLLVAGYVCLKPRLGEVDSHPRLGRGWFDALFGLGLGFYDGFLGPGTGTFWTMSFVLVMGFNLTKATGCTKIVNFASNISSLCLFLARGNVAIDAGLAMGLGQLLGARAGSKMVLRRGTKLIRPVFITVVFALLLKLLYDAFFHHPNS